MQSLKGQFLIAAGSLADPNFSRSVVLLLRHDAEGALGVVVNRPMDIAVRAACEQVLGFECDLDGPLHHGGPCEAVMMALYPVELDDDDDDDVVPGLRFTTDKDQIEQLLRDPPETAAGVVKVIVGYSGWSAGQLEGEMETGSWLLVPATAARALGAAGPLWARLVAEANLSKFIDPKWIPDDPSAN